MPARVEQIFARIGVTIEWRQPKSGSLGPDDDHGYFLKVMLFPYEPAASGHPEGTMGVVIGTRFPADAVWVFDPAIRRALQSSGRRSRPLSVE